MIMSNPIDLEICLTYLSFSSTLFLELVEYRNMFPGLGIATVAFTAYVIYDDFIKTPAVHEAHEAHGASHH